MPQLDLPTECTVQHGAVAGGIGRSGDAPDTQQDRRSKRWIHLSHDPGQGLGTTMPDGRLRSENALGHVGQARPSHLPPQKGDRAIGWNRASAAVDELQLQSLLDGYGERRSGIVERLLMRGALLLVTAEPANSGQPR